MKKLDTKKNEVNICRLDEIRQEERFELIAKEIANCKSRRYIVDKFTKEWGCQRITIETIIREAILWMKDTTYFERENIRTLNNERLDTLLDDAETVKEKLKIIDVINKTNGVYEQTINVGNKDEEEIKFDIAEK